MQDAADSNEVSMGANEVLSTPSKPVKRKPKSEAQKREATRQRVARWREKQAAKPSGIRAKWTEALKAMPEEERSELMAKQQHVRYLQMCMDNVISGVGYGNGTGTAENMFLPDLVFQEANDWVQQPGCELVSFWCPDSFANDLTATDWADECDDPIYKKLGLRTRLVRLFFREFLANVFVWCERNPDLADPAIADEVTKKMAVMQPLEPPRYVGTIPTFQSRNETDRKIQQREQAEQFRHREAENLARWQLEQLGQPIKPGVNI